MSSDDQKGYPYVDKLWEGVDVVMNQIKVSKNTCEELKGRIANFSAIEKENMQAYSGCVKKFNPLTESSTFQNVWSSLQEALDRIALTSKSVSDILSNLLPNFVNESEQYVKTLEQNRELIPPLKKKNESALQDFNSTKTKYLDAFEEWDEADAEGQKLVAENAGKKAEKALKKAEERKGGMDKKMSAYSDAMIAARETQEGYNRQMTEFLKQSQKAESRRLKALTKILLDVCTAYKNQFAQNLQSMEAIHASIMKIDDFEEISAFAEENKTNEKPKPLPLLHAGERGRKRGKGASSSSTPVSSSSSSSSTTTTAAATGFAPKPSSPPPQQQQQQPTPVQKPPFPPSVVVNTGPPPPVPSKGPGHFPPSGSVPGPTLSTSPGAGGGGGGGGPGVGNLRNMLAGKGLGGGGAAAGGPGPFPVPVPGPFPVPVPGHFPVPVPGHFSTPGLTVSPGVPSSSASSSSSSSSSASSSTASSSSPSSSSPGTDVSGPDDALAVKPVAVKAKKPPSAYKHHAHSPTPATGAGPGSGGGAAAAGVAGVSVAGAIKI